MNYRQLSKHTKHQKIWKQSFANELGRLSQGEGGRVEGTYTMLFIAQDQAPRDQLKDVSYGFIVVDCRTQKEEQHITRLTVGGNLIVYEGYTTTQTVEITTSNLIIKRTIYKPGVRCMCCDIENFYLVTP